MINRFFDFIQIAIWVGQGPENVFAVPYKHYKSRSIELTKFSFWGGQSSKIG